MPFKNFRLNRIQNGRLSATIYFHIADIRLDKIQNGRLSATIHFHMADIWYQY